MNMPIEQLVRVLIREVLARLNLIVLCFVILSLAVLIVGYNWPKKFSSSTSIYADQKNIIRPLMEGIADTTQVMSQANAKEVIFSRRAMREILETGGWMDDSPSPVEQERLSDEIRGRTDVRVSASGLIRIKFTDNDAERAFKTASKYAEMFIGETVRSKTQESREAYDFIDKQVGEYHTKLTEAEERLKRFRTENVDASPGRQNEVYEHINQLRRNLDAAELSLKESEIRKKSFESQLAGEAEVSKNSTTTTFYRVRLEQLQEELDSLRLSYHDSYPDVVRTKQQILDIKATIDQENTRAEAARRKALKSGEAMIDQDLTYTPLYQQLKSNLSATKTEIEMFKTRLSETKKRLGSERERARMMSEGQALESELVRDYEVNQTIYQDLLRKRENARVSMHLDMEGRGLTYKVQEPANLPLVPSGARFMHFLLAGPVLGIGAPLGLLFVLVQIDPRIRMEAVLSEKLELPVLAVIDSVPDAAERHSKHFLMVGGALIFVGLNYVMIIWAKLSEVQISTLLGGS